MQTVWNVLTSRAVDYGINDYDVFYFDPDTSWEAEDAVIRRWQTRFAGLGITVEARNQARVHLWYPGKHGLPYPELRCSTQGIDRFLTRNTQSESGARATVTRCTRRMAMTMSPTLIVRPNPGANFSAANYEAKAARWKALWPEITVLPADAIVVWRGAEPHHRPVMMGSLRSPRRRMAVYRTTPEVNPAFRRGGLMSFFRKQCASLPA